MVGSGFFHSPLLLQVLAPHSLLWLKSVLLHEEATVCSSTHLLLDIWVVSGTLMYKNCHGHTLSLLLGQHLAVRRLVLSRFQCLVLMLFCYNVLKLNPSFYVAKGVILSRNFPQRDFPKLTG